LPSDGEWQALVNFAGGNEIAGKTLKAKSGWNYTNEGNSGNGTDDYGFAALPGGCGIFSGSFYNVGAFGLWWSATENNAARAWYWNMYYSNTRVNRDNYKKELSLSVRCVRD
jgi:uncharacterized protein (TIGR02145 family)